MKKLILLFSLFIFANQTFSQKIYTPESTISSVIIYEKGAMVTRDVNTEDINANGTIIIDSLPQQINPKTINAKCGVGLKIISIKSKVDIQSIDDSHKKDSLKSILPILQDSIDYQNTLLKSIKKEIEVILKNDNFSNEDGTNMEQLAKASELYKTRLRALNLEQLTLTKLRDKFNDQKDKIQVSIKRLRPKTYKNHSVEIKIAFESSVDKSMSISYYTPNASWYTFYDLRVTESERNSYLDHKAFVSQATGEDWKNVKLTLSNRNPNKRVTPNPIRPYILQNINHHGYSQNTNHDNSENMIYGRITDTSGEALIGANVICRKSGKGVITDIDGRFKVQRPDNCPLTVSYTGYKTKEINVSGLSFCSITLNESTALDEIVSTVAGVSIDIDKDNNAHKAKEEERKSIAVVPQQSLNVHSFEITSPYSIPSNGEEYDVLLKTNDIPFAYQYITYPSQEPTAYLKVGIPEWRNYDLFSGKVNLFLEGQYTGVSSLNIESKTDTLWFSLGEDIGVHIEKEMVEEYNKKSFLKNKTIELHTFDIIVRNNKRKDITIDIMDQVPISTDDDIKVKVLEISEAEFDEKNGYLVWKETLTPGATKTYRVSYEIKYGKNVDIVNN